MDQGMMQAGLGGTMESRSVNGERSQSRERLWYLDLPMAQAVCSSIHKIHTSTASGTDSCRCSAESPAAAWHTRTIVVHSRPNTGAVQHTLFIAHTGPNALYVRTTTRLYTLHSPRSATSSHGQVTPTVPSPDISRRFASHATKVKVVSRLLAQG